VKLLEKIKSSSFYKRTLCKVGVHKWEYYKKDVVIRNISLKKDVRICEECGYKEVKTFLPILSKGRKWREAEYDTQEKRNILIKTILGEM
jgi:hypothetical protein